MPSATGSRHPLPLAGEVLARASGETGEIVHRRYCRESGLWRYTVLFRPSCTRAVLDAQTLDRGEHYAPLAMRLFSS